MARSIRHDIFIASTIGDLRQERKTVALAVIDAGSFPILLERFFGPGTPTSKKAIEDAIASADVFLLVVGTRSGTYIIETSEQTYIEYEYECALRLSKPILVLLPSEERFQRESTLAGESPDERNHVSEFRQRLLAGGHVVAYYDNVAELASRVLQLLPNVLVLMVVLAEGFSLIRSRDVAEKALNEIRIYSKELEAHISERGSYVRYDQPVRKLIEQLDNIGFPILPENGLIEFADKKRSRASSSYDYASELLQRSLLALEEKGLLIDPPWYKNPLAAGSLIVLLGSVPLEMNTKTVDGQRVATSMAAQFWDYESSLDGNVEKTHINIKIAKFIDNAIEHLGNSFVEAWKERNPERTKRLEDQSRRIPHNNANAVDTKKRRD